MAKVAKIFVLIIVLVITALAAIFINDVNAGIVKEVLHEEFLEKRVEGIDPHDNYAIELTDGRIIVMAHGDKNDFVGYRGKRMRSSEFISIMKDRYGHDKEYYLDSCYIGRKSGDGYTPCGKGNGVSIGSFYGPIWYSISFNRVNIVDPIDHIILTVCTEYKNLCKQLGINRSSPFYLKGARSITCFIPKQIVDFIK